MRPCSSTTTTGNRYLVDHSAMLIAVYDGMLGGTMYTISYAMKRGLDVVTLDIP